MTRKDVIENRLSTLTADFGRYVKAYDRLVPFTGEQLTAHRATIALRHEAGNVRMAIEDGRFVSSLRRTLLAWGVGRRASHLVPEGDFTTALRAALPQLEELESLTIGTDLPSDIADQLWHAIDSLGVVTNQAKLVAGTKTLHHLLPDLVVPMDRAWTGTFFRLHLPEWQDRASQRRIFRLVYDQLTALARQVHPERYVTDEGWRTSRAKILDNALIGFCKLELGGGNLVVEHAVNEITLDVAGYPPAKNEALSMLGAGHSHALRVRLLLEAAHQALKEQAFVPIDGGHLALDVTVHAPIDQPAWDATNYLGGIGDVLEDKSRRGALDQLGDLAAVWLYRNDRQIKEVTYREIESGSAGYTVTVRALGR